MNPKDVDYYQILEAFYGFENCMIGMVHLVVGVQIERKLRKFSPKFHAKYKHYLNLITLGLSLPTLLRGLADLLIAFSPEFKEYYELNLDWTEPVFFLLCDLIPLISNLSALVFGVIRSMDKTVSASYQGN
jgi:hypothetical protein